MSTKTVLAVDLFCGAGGTSTGLLQAMDKLGLKVSLLAINHWKIAIETHSLNHPCVKHVCDALENLDPRELVPSGKLRILVASPECTHFSNARGGRPMSKQSRATIKHVLRWLRNLDVQDVLIENVREFQTWGPLHREGPNKDKPIKARKGQFFKSFIRSLVALGYNVDWRVLCAADYGDPTTRERMFIRASKDTIHWPAPTHASPKKAQLPLFEKTFNTRSWKPAREIIDWSDLGKSIFNRDKPLSINTIRRIEAGLRKFSGLPFILPFILPLEGFFRGNQPRSVDDPLPTVVAGRGAGSVVQPFILKSYQGSDAVSVDAPMPTLTANVEHLGVVNPFVLKMYQSNDASPIDTPLPTVTAKGNHLGIVNPFLVQLEHSSEASGHDRRVYSPERPLPTVTNRSSIGVINPFIVKMDEGGSLQSLDRPLKTVTGADARALVNGFMIEYHGASYEGGDRARSLDEPLATLGAGGCQHGLAFLVRYNGVGIGQSVDDQLATMTGKDRFALCVPWVDGVYLLDIYLRMLKPSEMAAAHSFPKSYVFVGSREIKVRQIGNSVPVNLAEALVMSIMDVNL